LLSFEHVLARRGEGEDWPDSNDHHRGRKKIVFLQKESFC